MAVVKCPDCGGEISTQAVKCPKCGRPQKRSQTIQGIITILVMIGLAWFFFGGGLQSETNRTMQGITDKVADDAVKQYNIAAAQGDQMQKCVQAGFVAAAFLQAKNDVQYNVWKSTQSSECAQAGVPH